MAPLGNRIFSFLSSLKLAIFVLLSLAAALAAGTFIESLYDTPTAQYWVYRSLWFHGVLAFLGINIFCVAVSRYPWKKKHIPFLMAHVGILTLLTGAWITERNGLDGSLRISEGETSSTVELDTAQLIVTDREQVRIWDIPWQPSQRRFKPMRIGGGSLPYAFTVDQYITHAEPSTRFVASQAPQAAVHFKLVGGPMRISQEFWLWTGDPSVSDLSAGPARFVLQSSEANERINAAPRADGRPLLILTSDETRRELRYRAYSSSGKKVAGRIGQDQVGRAQITPGWKGGVHIEVLEWLPRAQPRVSYSASRIQTGNQAPPPAIHLTSIGSGAVSDETSDSTSSWLGLGDRAVLQVGQRDIGIAFYPKRLVLPFSVQLHQFKIDRYEGTTDPSSFASRVTVEGAQGVRRDVSISMNEPLQYSGITLYQASYEDAQPRPVTSIFAVNRDPGRAIKYVGSLLIVLGSILLFLSRYKKKSEINK